MGARRLLPVIRADDLCATRDFYTRLLNFTVKFDSAWYVLLASESDPALEIALQRLDQTPLAGQDPQPGSGCMYLSIEVDNVYQVCERAKDLGVEILEQPDKGAMDGYDRRRVLLRDPCGTLLEVLTPTDPQEAVNAELMFDQ